MESFRRLFNLAVGQSNPLVLPQVLGPVFNQEAFNMPAGRCRILEHAPTDGSIP
jgi:hypothetical protein